MKQKGFTLVEVLAVIGILAILAVITYPIIDDVITGSREKSFKASVEELDNAAEVDYIENGRSGEIPYTLTTSNTFACSGCTALDYQGEIKKVDEEHNKIILTDGKVSYIDIANDLYKASLSGGKVKVTEK